MRSPDALSEEDLELLLLIEEAEAMDEKKRREAMEEEERCSEVVAVTSSLDPPAPQDPPVTPAKNEEGNSGMETEIVGDDELAAIEEAMAISQPPPALRAIPLRAPAPAYQSPAPPAQQQQHQRYQPSILPPARSGRCNSLGGGGEGIGRENAFSGQHQGQMDLNVGGRGALGGSTGQPARDLGWSPDSRLQPPVGLGGSAPRSSFVQSFAVGGTQQRHVGAERRAGSGAGHVQGGAVGGAAGGGGGAGGGGQEQGA